MDREEIGNKLRMLRGVKTLDEVAEALGVSPSAVSNWENGIRIPRDELKKKIAVYYKIPLEDIFFED